MAKQLCDSKITLEKQQKLFVQGYNLEVHDVIKLTWKHRATDVTMLLIISRASLLINITPCYKRKGLKVGCFIGFLHPPEENSPIEKIMFVSEYKNVL